MYKIRTASKRCLTIQRVYCFSRSEILQIKFKSQLLPFPPRHKRNSYRRVVLYIYVPRVSLSDFSRPLASLSSIARCECLTKRIHMPWMFAKHQGFSTIRTSERSDSLISEYSLTIFIRRKSTKSFLYCTHLVSAIRRKKSGAKLVVFVVETRLRGTEFSILSVESGSLSVSLFFSSRAEGAISFNFPTMRMRYGALRGFESANAANRYATSNLGLGERIRTR